jgi:hypothetical protein
LTGGWLPQFWNARTLLDTCANVELRVIYVGKFPPWKDHEQRKDARDESSQIREEPDKIPIEIIETCSVNLT